MELERTDVQFALLDIRVDQSHESFALCSEHLLHCVFFALYFFARAYLYKKDWCFLSESILILLTIRQLIRLFDFENTKHSDAVIYEPSERSLDLVEWFFIVCF